jgi:hypothetical protein
LRIFDDRNIILSADTQETARRGFLQPGEAIHQNGAQMYDQLMQAVKIGLTQGLHYVFITGALIKAPGFVATFFLKEIPLRGEQIRRGLTEEASGE